MRNLFFIVLTLLQVTNASAQTTRQIEVKVTDERGQALVGADVIFQRTASALQFDEVSASTNSASYEALGRTDASGLATGEVKVLDGEEPDDALRVMAWKAGYTLQSTTVMKKAELQCVPLSKRTIQIVDAEDKPVKGLRVEHKPVSSEFRLCPEEVLHTDEFGLVTLSAAAKGGLRLSIHEPSGVVHNATVTEVMNQQGQLSDPRDIMVVHLSSHGKIVGKLPAEVSQTCGIRFTRKFDDVVSRLREAWTTFNDQEPSRGIVADKDGHFHLDAVTPGDGWLVVYLLEPMTANSDAGTPSLPIGLHRVQITAGETTVVDVNSQPTAKVSGRIVSTTGAGDFAGTRVLISRVIKEPGQRLTQQFRVASAVATADGTFVCSLPVGKYIFQPALPKTWKINSAAEFEVGAGAATVAINDILVTPLKKATVVWKQKPRTQFSLLNFDNRIAFWAKGQNGVDQNRTDQYLGESVLTDDGYGKVYLPPETQVTGIYRGSIGSTRSTASAFVDNDPSDNFDLELIRKPQGSSSNIGMHGRVVDSEGKGIARVPVDIALNVEPIASGVRQLPFMFSPQLLDTVTTDDDGNYELPPRQILSRIIVSGNSTTAQHRYTFTVSTPANPEPFEVTKVITEQPQQWSMLDIELPNLVVTRALGGNRLTGKVLNSEGRPSVGELLRVIDKRRQVKLVTGSNGEFSIDDVAAPIWLLRQTDWTIHKVSEFGQPLQVDLGPKPTQTGSVNVRKLLGKEQRKQLAQELLQAIPAPRNVVMQVGGARIQLQLTDDFYLEPDKTFDQLLSLPGVNGDNLRRQFVAFWMNISDAQVKRLAEAMTPGINRVHLLRILAERSPSIAAYEQVMNAIEYPEQTRDRI